MALYDGNWEDYRNEMCICPECGKDEISECNCSEENDADISTQYNEENDDMEME